MFKDLFLIVYGFTVLFFLIIYTYSMLKECWDKSIQTTAEIFVDKIEQESGFQFNTKAIANFIEFETIVFYLLPLINTYLMVMAIRSYIKVKKVLNAETKRNIDKHSKFLND